MWSEPLERPDEVYGRLGCVVREVRAGRTNDFIFTEKKTGPRRRDDPLRAKGESTVVSGLGCRSPNS